MLHWQHLATYLDLIMDQTCLTECESIGMIRNQNGSLIDPEKYNAILKKRPTDSFKELAVQHNLPKQMKTQMRQWENKDKSTPSIPTVISGLISNKNGRLSSSGEGIQL